MATQFYNDLRNARTIINAQYKPEKEPQTRDNGRSNIESGLVDYFDWLSELYLDDWKSYLPPNLPDSIIPWYERRRAVRLEGWWKFHRGMTSRLVNLNNLNALKAYFVYRSRANNGETKNKIGLEPGETIVGNKTVAREAGVNEVYLRKANRLLAEAGLVVSVRRLWFNGPYVRRVALTPDEVLKQNNIDTESGELPRIPFKV